MAHFILIENNSGCNRKCPYCPHFWSSIQDYRMPKSLFEKIVDDLIEISYCGSILFGPRSEPLLDDRLPSFVRYAKDKLPKISVYLKTNGDFLTIEKFKELIDAGIDEIDVSDHFKIFGNHYVIDEPKQAIKTYLQLDTDDKKRLHFHDYNYKKVRKLDTFHNRSGLVPLKDCISFESYSKTCEGPEGGMTIDVKGQVLLCCRQWTDTPTYGNVQHEYISDIWKSTEYSRIRKNLRKGIFELKLCNTCAMGYMLDAVQVRKIKD